MVNEWYVYPDWAYALGWMMTLSSVFVVLFTVARQMYLTAGTFRQVSAHLYAAQDYLFLKNLVSLPLLRTLKAQLLFLVTVNQQPKG